MQPRARRICTPPSSTPSPTLISHTSVAVVVPGAGAGADVVVFGAAAVALRAVSAQAFFIADGVDVEVGLAGNTGVAVETITLSPPVGIVDVSFFMLLFRFLACISTSLQPSLTVSLTASCVVRVASADSE